MSKQLRTRLSSSDHALRPSTKVLRLVSQSFRSRLREKHAAFSKERPRQHAVNRAMSDVLLQNDDFRRKFGSKTGALIAPFDSPVSIKNPPPRVRDHLPHLDDNLYGRTDLVHMFFPPPVRVDNPPFEDTRGDIALTRIEFSPGINTCHLWTRIGDDGGMQTLGFGMVVHVFRPQRLLGMLEVRCLIDAGYKWEIIAAGAYASSAGGIGMDVTSWNARTGGDFRAEGPAEEVKLWDDNTNWNPDGEGENWTRITQRLDKSVFASSGREYAVHAFAWVHANAEGTKFLIGGSRAQSAIDLSVPFGTIDERY